MAYVNPQVADFKAYFFRDFPYGTDIETTVTDPDINKALQQVNMYVAFNPCMWSDQASYSIGYLYLAAHYMVMDLRASSQGINGQYAFLEQSKSVGSVSASYAIPQRVLDNPDWAMLMKTNYGAQYLQYILPLMGGQMFMVHGRTLP